MTFIFLSMKSLTMLRRIRKTSSMRRMILRFMRPNMRMFVAIGRPPPVSET